MKLDNGEFIEVETLKQGSHFGVCSSLIEEKQLFHFRAKTHTVTIHELTNEKVEFLRERLPDLDDAFGKIE